MYDVIVVGARVAGSPLAMLLADRGYRILLLDRDRFPSDTMSTHYIHQPGVAKLREWGLLGPLLAAGCAPIEQMTVVRAGIALHGMAEFDGIRFTLCPRRTVLDDLLVRAAVERGAELRERFVVDDLVWEDGRVVGVRGHHKGGGAVEERARLVVGADGAHSLVARKVQAGAYHTIPAMGCGYYAYYDGVVMSGGEVRFFDDCIVFAFPTNDGQTCIGVEWPNARFPALRQQVDYFFAEAVGHAPDLAERVEQGRRVTRFVGTGDLPNFFRTPHGPGWALVGDAGYHKDPVTGNGITDAFLDAGHLARAIDVGFSGRQSLADAMQAYEDTRNERALPLYHLAIQALSFAPPSPEQMTLLRALQGNQPDTDRFLGVQGGATPAAMFFDPANLGRIIARAQQQAVTV